MQQDPYADWNDTPPEEPGFYWLYGDECYGSMGCHYGDNPPPPRKELHYVSVRLISNGAMAVTSGRFMSLRKFDPVERREGHIGKWRRVVHPPLPTDHDT